MAQQQSSVRNRLLTVLPPDVLVKLLPNLQRVCLLLRKTLAVPAKPIEAAYFVESGWVSMVTHLDEGTQAEVELIGREGMVGQSLVTGVDTAFAETRRSQDGYARQVA